MIFPFLPPSHLRHLPPLPLLESEALKANLNSPLSLAYSEDLQKTSFERFKKKWPLKIPLRIFPYKKALEKNQSSKNLKTVQVFFIRSQMKINKNLLQKMPLLKLIITTTSGFDHIDLEACHSFRVKVSNTPHAYSESVSELTLFFFLALNRKWSLINRAIEKNLWKGSFEPGQVLKGKNLGLIGLGNIGSKVALLAKSFGMNVSSFDPYILKTKFKRLKVKEKSFKDLLSSSDILSLHLPLTEETKHLINKKSLSLLPPHAFLINTSRGKIICEKDLVEALKKKKIGGLGLDVFEEEPFYFKSPLFSYIQNLKIKSSKKFLQTPLFQPKTLKEVKEDSIFLSPHIGSYTKEVLEKALDEGFDILIQYLEKGILKNALPHSLPWWKKYKNP